MGESFRKPWLPFLFKLQIFQEHRELKKDITKYRECCQGILKQRKAEFLHDIGLGKEKNASPDLLYYLIKLQFEAKSDDEKLSDEDILSQYIMFVNSGEDTVANLLTMCMYNLTQHSQYKDQIREEIKLYIQDIDNPTYEEINKFQILNGFTKETLRIHGPSPIIPVRIATQDNMLGDIKIKKGTFVSAFTTVNTFREDIFTEPNKFKPERWIGDGEGTNLKNPFIFIPFSVGPRNCIGQHLAMLETKLFLIQLLHRYDLELIPNYELRMGFKFGLGPVTPVKIKFNRLHS